MTSEVMKKKEAEEEEVTCSICLDDIVTIGGDRSTARLKCGHDFHLDCIGSAFNIAKGEMRCPNCRNVETGNWRCTSGTGSGAATPLTPLLMEEDLDYLDFPDDEHEDGIIDDHHDPAAAAAEDHIINSYLNPHAPPHYPSHRAYYQISTTDSTGYHHHHHRHPPLYQTLITPQLLPRQYYGGGATLDDLALNDHQAPLVPSRARHVFLPPVAHHQAINPGFYYPSTPVYYSPHATPTVVYMQ